MSDLAPFVAATLRDKVIIDQQEEINRLRKQLRIERTITITGPGGSPIFAEAIT